MLRVWHHLAQAREAASLCRFEEAREALAHCTRATAAAYGPPLSVNYSLARAMVLEAEGARGARELFSTCLREARPATSGFI